MLVFEHAGRPVIVFPASLGRFFDYEERGMVEALRPALDTRRDRARLRRRFGAGSWYYEAVHLSGRAARHAPYGATRRAKCFR